MGVIVRRCCCSAHTGNELSSCVGVVKKQSCAFLWASSGLSVNSQHFIENEGP